MGLFLGKPNNFQIFSGHDTVLIPLARSLRIPYIEPPYYATRMVFEVIIFHYKFLVLA